MRWDFQPKDAICAVASRTGYLRLRYLFRNSPCAPLYCLEWDEATLGLLDFSVFGFGLGSPELEPGIDRKSVEEHIFATVLVGKGGAEPDPAVFLVGAGAPDDGIDLAIGFRHGGKTG